MSFQHKTFWMPSNAGCLTDGEMGYDNSSRMEAKRGHQWFTDGSTPELFSSKKQAIETVSGRPVPGVSHMDVSLWDNSSGFQSAPGQFSDRLFESEPIRTVNLVDRNISDIGPADMHIGRKDFENQYGNDSSIGLSMSHAMEDPISCQNFGGIRKVKVNQVRDSDNAMPAPIRHSFSRENSGAITMGTTYGKNDENIMSLGQNYSNKNENNISMGSAFSKTDDNFISIGHSFNKDDGDFISMGHNYGKSDTNNLSISQPFDKVDGTFISMGQSYEKTNGRVISLQTSYNKGPGNFISMRPTYCKANENFISMASSYSKGTREALSFTTTYDKVDPEIVNLDPNYDRGDSGMLDMGRNYNKGKGTTISFGGFDEEPVTNNPSGGIISSYDLLMGTQNSSHISEVSIQKDFVDSNAGSVNNVLKANNPKMDNSKKSREPKTTKKVSPNNFPSNVKSLLSTGMLDGVPVKYVSWSREKNLKGIIKGTGYMCNCDKCQQSKALNAYEFERHAGCKTKHPNNHIYFENGKTIYNIVQELKNTPQEMLFDAIENVTGSPINQKNFRIWKASYQAATRELQRIYGTDEGIMPS